jgi:hypothetical protein
MKSQQIALTSARPMITVEAEFFDGGFKTAPIEHYVGEAEVRFRCKVKENDRKLITNEAIEWIKGEFGEDVKIEWNIIPDERESRSEAIMNAKTLLEEVEEYARVTEFELPESTKEKVQKIEEEAN